MPLARQVPIAEASVMRVAEPLGDWVPPDTLRLTTTGRTLRSAGLLLDDSPGTSMNWNNSSWWRSNLLHKA